LVEDALGIANAVSGSRHFHLVGHDWGGQLAWLIATHHPDKLQSLSVLSRPHPRAFSAALKNDAAQSERSRHHRAFDDPETANKLLAEDARRLKRMLTHQNVSESDAAAYIAPLREPAALDAALNWYRAADRKGLSAELPSIRVRVPTLYIWGDADATVGRAAAEATASCVTASYRFEVIAGAGHFLTDESPERSTQLLCEHIARCEAGA
jgi:pimeloyl-ACP methyl ester carboxylesterase